MEWEKIFINDVTDKGDTLQNIQIVHITQHQKNQSVKKMATYLWNLKNNTNIPIEKTETNSQT